VPEISYFYGIRITIHWNEHRPPHFHAHYSGNEALININTLEVYQGSLPPHALRLVTEWAALHQAELIEDWNLAEAGRPVLRIAPLP